MKLTAIAPCRLGLFGGGTDVAPYSERHGGICLNVAINIRQKITIGGRRKLLKNDNPKFFEAFFDKALPFEHEFDGEIESGLGSSASAAVALMGIIDRVKGLGLTKDEIAERAWSIEVNKLGLYGGKQDQYAAVYGGANVFTFGERITRTIISKHAIEKIYPSMVLCYLGKNRRSGKIQEGFKDLSKEQIEALDSIKDLALEGIYAVSQGDANKVGRLLDVGWDLKKRSNKGVSNRKIDKIYAKAKELGAWGGKIMGAGGGGHFLFMVDPEIRDNFIDKIGIKHIDFSIDYNGLEVRLI